MYGYVSVEPVERYASIIKEVCREIGVECIDDLHVTLMYDVRNVIPEEDIPQTRYKYTAYIDGVDMLGSGEWQAVVIKLKSKDLDNRHQDLKDVGFVHSYDEFIAHLSIAYTDDLSVLDKVSNNLDKFKEALPHIIFNNEKYEELKQH